MSWLKGDLILGWTAAQDHPALAEVRFRVHERLTETWETRMANTSLINLTYQMTVENLLKHTAYQIQIRHRSIRVLNPLWSDWSPVVTVPAELHQQPVVSIETKVVNGSRKLRLSWTPMFQAASVTGVTYSITDTQSSHRCPCKQVHHRTQGTHFTTYVSYSAVNISVIAKNAVGVSPTAVASVGQIEKVDLKTCDSTQLGKKLEKRNCLELYEFQDGDWRPAEVITSTKRNKNETMKDYIYYLYFEHRCPGRKPRTDKMCVFYHKEGVPLSEPLDFRVFDELSNSVSLSWKTIPIESLRGFLSHYRLCSIKINSEEKDEVCYNVSASVTEHRFENLTPGSKYNISLAAATGAGEGPQVFRIVNTLPESHVTVLLWVLSGLFVMFLISTMCTCMLRQIKQKIFPPVPKPVILDFTHYQAQNQKTLERPEEVDELILYQMQPEGKSTTENAEERLFRGHWYEDKDEDTDDDNTGLRTSEDYGDEHLDCTAQTRKGSRDARTDLDHEIERLIYKNGLVFDGKADLQ
ncbi:leukemia inhibitory factor receptor isoform X3 [Takifugu rubripes]|nr:leukemia inhibitory factor receptor isoform X3 [Takifugu rubripes]